MYGIDKSEIRNIIIESIDFQVLRSNQKVVYNVSQSELAQVIKVHGKDEYMKLDRLYIPDDELFNSFTMDYKKDMGTRGYYTSLDLAIKPKKGREPNLIPMTLEQYKDKLETIRQYLINKYGVYISYEDSRIYYIELNITQMMKYKFGDYYYLFEAIKNNRNKKKYLKYSYTGEGNIETFELFHKRRTQVMKFYDKTKQLYDCFRIQVDNKYMRLEYSLTGYDKIKQLLGSDKIQDLTDDSIRSFLNESINSDVFTPIQKHIDKTNIELAKKYQEIKKQHKRGYLRQFANYCNSRDTDIFDIEQIYNICHKDMSQHNHYKRNKTMIEGIISMTLGNSFEKFREFKDKFSIN